MAELFKGMQEWRTRPADERFSTLKELHAVSLARRQASVESRVQLKDFKFQPVGKDVVLNHGDVSVLPTHWSFGQMCDYLDLPAWHERKLPAELVAAELAWAMNHSERAELMMTWANGEKPGLVRSFTTPMYGQLWDHQVVEWLLTATENESNGWHRPPAITDDKYPSGIYGGDRNMFAFMVNDEHRLDDGSEKGLGRGFFCWNSEVKQMSFGFQSFLYRYICGNHIVWGAQEVKSLRMIHLGPGFKDRAGAALKEVLDGYLALPMDQDQKVIDAARKFQVAGKVDDIFPLLTSKRIHFPVKDAKAIVATAVEAGTDPTNLWDLVNAATMFSQKRTSHTDERNEFDRRAARLLDMVRL